MWAEVVFVLLASAPACRGAAHSAYQYSESDAEAQDDDTDFYDNYEYDEETTTVSTLSTPTTEMEVLSRRRRYETIRTLNPGEIHDVRGKLNDILYGHKLDFLTSRKQYSKAFTDAYDYLDNKSDTTIDSDFSTKREPMRNVIIRKRTSPEGLDDESSTIELWSPEVSVWNTKDTVQHWSPQDTVWSPTETMQHWSSEVNTQYWQFNGSEQEQRQTQLQVDLTPVEDPLDYVSGSHATDDDATELSSTRDKPTRHRLDYHRLGTRTTTTRKTPQMDINAIIAIIANLTYDYDWNLTEQFNRSLIQHGVPTCLNESKVTTTTTTPSQYDFFNSSVVSKCFVCGLKTPEIPQDAYCADAFAGDFLPLTPVDPRVRGQIAKYRKYCRFLDVHNYVENPSESKSIYGRFTGGCGVRWTDLSGVYTQRTCRSRFKPLMGKHFASKRMAKLELALINVENGCIISPMASLLPLSRSISLYARFHACVCVGNWCNSAERARQWRLHTTVLWYWLTNRIL